LVNQKPNQRTKELNKPRVSNFRNSHSENLFSRKKLQNNDTQIAQS